MTPLDRTMTLPLSHWALSLGFLLAILSLRAEAEVPRLQSEWKPTIPLAMWAWDWDWARPSPAQFEDYITGLLDLCAKRNVRSVYLGIDFPVPEDRVGITEQLLSRAHEAGVRVEACPNAGREGGVFEGLLPWNESHPPAQQFDGVYLDVEGGSINDHWLARLGELWATKVKRLKEITPEGFTVGIWLTPSAWWSEERNEKFTYRLQDVTDYIGVGSYFQGDRTRDFFTGPSKPGLDYAAKTGKKILLGLETEVWFGEGHNFPGWEHMSFASLGELELRHRIERINSALGEHPGFGGVIIETYNAYRTLCLVQDEVERDERLYGALDRQAEALSEGTRVHVGGFAVNPGHSAEDPALETQLGTFEITPALEPGHALVFTARFERYGSTRPNPLTEQAAVPAEVCWLGFRRADSEYRILRIDHNGSLGMRVVNGHAPGLLPAEQRDRFRISFSRFAPEPDKEYEVRLYFFADSRVMLKVVEPGNPEAVWHSERMDCVERNLGRMYIEVAASPPGGHIGGLSWDPAAGSLTVTRDDAPLATIRDLRMVTLPEVAGQ